MNIIGCADLLPMDQITETCFSWRLNKDSRSLPAAAAHVWSTRVLLFRWYLIKQIPKLTVTKLASAII